MRPLIGIPCHADYADGTKRPIYCNNRAYVHAVEHAGGVPILIPYLHDFRMFDTLLPRLDGLLLSGGIDIDPLFMVKRPIHSPTSPTKSLMKSNCSWQPGPCKRTFPRWEYAAGCKS